MSAAESPWNKLLLAFQDIFQDLTIPIYQMHQCHWSSEAARNREKGEVITFHSKSCSGVPLTFTTKANFLRRLLETRKPNQAGEILLSSLALSYQFRPLWIIYLHSFHLSTLGAFFFFDVWLCTEEHLWCLLPFTAQCQQVGRWVILRQTFLTVSSGSGWKKMEFPWMSGKHFINNLSCRKLSVKESFEEPSFPSPQNNILRIISL